MSEINFASVIARAGNNRIDSTKANGVRFGRGHVVRSFTHDHTAQHATLHIIKEN